MEFDLVVSENCCACERAEVELGKYSANKEFIEFKTTFQNLSNHKTSIVPSLFINGKLFSYGDIDFSKLDKKVKAIGMNE